MFAIAQHPPRAGHRSAHPARPANLARAVLAGAAAAFGVLFGVTVEDLTTRD